MAKSVLEGGFPAKVWVEGEISNLTLATSGHRYFDIKDDKARVPCAMFRGSAAKNDPNVLKQIKAGDQVRVSAQVTMYPAQGKYQLIVSTLEPVGAGQLMREFEALKQKLSAEGLFDDSRKRALPTWARTIAVVTSATGAAVRDVLSTLERRAAFIPVRVYPTMVQGETAPPKIIAALEKAYGDIANGLPIDVIVVTRGGGSIEDLHCFNDEALARIIAQSPVPTVSGVGHEIDFTIADFVADVRAPTPTGAAELVSPDKVEQTQLLVRRAGRLQTAMQTVLQQRQKQLAHHQHRLSVMHPSKRLQVQSQRVDELARALSLSANRLLNVKKATLMGLKPRLAQQNPLLRLREKRDILMNIKQRLGLSVNQTLGKKQQQTKGLSARLTLLSPYGVMARGYSLVYRDGKLVKSIAQLDPDASLSLRLADGNVTARVEQIDKK